MAFASRLLFRSTRQLYAGQIILQSEHAVPVRFFAKEAAPPALKEDEKSKNFFSDLKKELETAIGVLLNEKITIDPDDPAAAKVMKTVREKARLLPELSILSIGNTIQTRTRTQFIPDARKYLLTLKKIGIEWGYIRDDLGAEAMMMDALEKVEKELKKPLMRHDKKGMALFMTEFDKINQKLGIRKEELPKPEEHIKIVKAQLEGLNRDFVQLFYCLSVVSLPQPREAIDILRKKLDTYFKNRKA